eukprot:TRINITY_DN5499_c0_g1_i1.p1 TRINITY_DN5499_c0_g1~~TRINITY_DN5499_c0_g1_i1.p1  ORF type:complete len:1070 (-),score=204.93 TRINITY_DN5499_c0_g1_i1:386-3595(-)
MSPQSLRQVFLLAIFVFCVPLAQSVRDVELAPALQANKEDQQHDLAAERSAHDGQLEAKTQDYQSRMVDDGQDSHDFSSLSSLMEYGEDSHFWHTSARALAETVLELRKKEVAKEGDETDVHAESYLEEGTKDGAAVEAMRIRRTVRHGILDDHQRQALASEDALVRRAILGALGKGEGQSDFEELMSCAKTFGGGTNTQEKASSYVMEPAKDGEPTVASVAREAWRDSIAAFKGLGDFFTKFLKIAIGMGLWPPNLVPKLVFKCTPIHKCVKELAKLPGEFLKFFGTLTYGIFRVLLQMLKSVARFFGMPKTADTGKVEPSFGDVPVRIEGKAGQVPPKSAIDDFVAVHNAALFDAQDVVDSGCYVCQGSLNTVIKIDPLSIVTTILSGGLFGMLTFSIGSAPRPISSPAGNCITCLYNWRKMLSRMFMSNKGLATKAYFSPGKCNAHSVGMCMMLEKVRSCNIEITDNGKLEFGGASRKKWLGTKSSTPQHDFCDSFKGTQLELTRVNGQIQCPAVFMEAMKQQNISVKPLSAQGITHLDLKEGCHYVRQSMHDFYQVCEKGAKKASISRWAYNKVKTRKYGDDVWEPSSVEEASQKCKALFGCPDDVDLQETQTDNATIEWQDLTTDIRRIIDEVDEFSGSPQSMTAATATFEIVKLLDETTADFGALQGMIDKSSDAEAANKERRWGNTLAHLFHINLWDDRCFSGLSKPVDLWKGSGSGAGARKKRLENLYQKLGQPGQRGQRSSPRQFRFFETFAKAIGYEHWQEDRASRCKIHAPRISEDPDLSLAPQQKVKVESKFVVFAQTAISRWMNETPRNTLHLVTLEESGIDLERYEGGWQINACTSSSCSALPKATKVTKIQAKQAAGAVVGSLRKTVASLVKDMHDVADKHGSQGKPTSAKRAAVLLKEWYAALKSTFSKVKEDATSPQTTYDESFFASQLKDLLAQDPTLHRNFKAKRWSLEEGTSGAADKGLHLFIDGTPLTRYTQLAPIRRFFARWEEASFRTTMSGISSLLGDIMHNLPQIDILEPGNPKMQFDKLGDVTPEVEAGITKLLIFYEMEVDP